MNFPDFLLTWAIFFIFPWLFHVFNIFHIFPDRTHPEICDRFIGINLLIFYAFLFVPHNLPIDMLILFGKCPVQYNMPDVSHSIMQLLSEIHLLSKTFTQADRKLGMFFLRLSPPLKQASKKGVFWAGEGGIFQWLLWPSHTGFKKFNW